MKTNPNDIYADYYDEVYNYIKGDPVTSSECLLISALINKPNGKILDLGAGTGRHAVELAKRGYKVTAVDSSAKMLAHIKIKNPKIAVLHQDILTFVKSNQETFDFVILMWNSLNEIALTKKSLNELLRGIKKRLSPDGIALVNIDIPDQNHPYKPEFETKLKTAKGDEIIVNWSNRKSYGQRNTTVSKEQLTINGRIMRPAYIKQYWWTQAEIERFAAECGFTTKSYPLECNNELYLALSKKENLLQSGNLADKLGE